MVVCSWSFIWIFIYNILNINFEWTTIVGSRKVGPVNQVKHISMMGYIALHQTTLSRNTIVAKLKIITLQIFYLYRVLCLMTRTDFFHFLITLSYLPNKYSKLMYTVLIDYAMLTCKLRLQSSDMWHIDKVGLSTSELNHILLGKIERFVNQRTHSAFDIMNYVFWSKHVEEKLKILQILRLFCRYKNKTIFLSAINENQFKTFNR